MQAKRGFLAICLVIITLAIVFTGNLQTQASQRYPSDAVSYWAFDEGSGEIAYDSVNGNHGTIQGATWTNGKFGSALSFDGINDCVLVGASNKLFPTNESLTFTAWAKLDAIRTGTYAPNRIFTILQDSINSNVALGISSDGRIAGFTRDGTTAVEFKGDAVNIGEWYHFALVKQGATHQLYLNGIASGPPVNYTPSKQPSSDSAAIGQDNFSGKRYLDGIIDEVCVWSRALSAQEIAALANPITNMSSFKIDLAVINFTDNGANEDMVHIKGNLKLGNGNSVNISEYVTITVGSISETILMEEKGGKNKSWVYTRPRGYDVGIKSVTINWGKGDFDIKMDKADLSQMTNPNYVLISIQIGDDLGEAVINMKEHKHWQYNAQSNN